MTGQTMTGRRYFWLLTAILAAFSVMAVACGSDDTSPTQSNGGANPTSTGGDLSGEIKIDGSSTVFPITQAISEAFRAAGNNGVQVVIGVSGTGGGFKRFVDGDTAISNASRPIKESEAAKAAENGVEYIELEVALDGISVLVNPKNDFVSCLTKDELTKIWNPDSKLKNWNGVRDSFPDRKMTLYGPGTDSGTFDYFTEVIGGASGASRADFIPSEDDNVLVAAIAGDRNSLGYFGYAYYVENTDKLKALAIDNGEGCVEPTPATINDGTYAPLARPVYVYVNKAELARPEVRAFIEFFLENGGTTALKVGYVALPDSEYEAGLAAIR